ncbi:MAG: ATP-binding protein [Leeuwenhoekiella sp.]
MPKAFLNWSSGKDAALALYFISNENKFEVSALLTTVNDNEDRVSMHGLRKVLLRKQAESVGLPLHEIILPKEISMINYTETLSKAFQSLVELKFSYAIYGDIFLEDLRAYRDKNLCNVGLKGIYPLWKKDTAILARQIIDLGFKAITVCVSDKLLGKEFCGITYDHDFLKKLPADVDPCGERGEFHTFVYDGPNFKFPIPFKIGDKVKRDLSTSTDSKPNWESVFWYCDLLGNP